MPIMDRVIELQASGPTLYSRSNAHQMKILPFGSRCTESIRAGERCMWHTVSQRLQHQVCQSSATPQEAVHTSFSVPESGKVLYVGQGVAIVDELDNDAPIGTLINFSGNSRGALMWRRDDNLCYVLLLDGIPNEGDTATCAAKPHRPREVTPFRWKGSPSSLLLHSGSHNQPALTADVSTIGRFATNNGLQDIDAKQAQQMPGGEGTPSQREFEDAEVPVSESMFGRCTDFLGRDADSAQLDKEPYLPLLNHQPTVDDREQILEALPLGVKAVDILTPIGRGQAQLVTGLSKSGKTRLVLDSILGQRGTSVKCVYASVGSSAAESENLWRCLQEQGASENTHMVVASDAASLGEQYAALCSACSVGEQVRDAGGHSLVVLDDVRSMVQMWEHITEVVARLRPDVIAQNGSSPGEEEELIEYEGMLISAAAAQRRRFFSLLVQRAAKMHRRLGAGSMTLLLVMPGLPATGVLQKAPDMSKYKHLSPELRAKLEAKLGGIQGDAGMGLPKSSESNARTEVVEEFMSMTDGQTVMSMPKTSEDSASVQYSINASASVSRIGARAYSPVLRELAKTARLDLAQAADSQQFSSARSEAETVKADRRALQLGAALAQKPGNPVPVAHQVVMLLALQSAACADIRADQVPSILQSILEQLEQTDVSLLQTIVSSETLSEENSLILQDTINKLLRQKC